ncbi:unnamed protein product [Adineta ricciae]|uniref:Ubiquitin carboxyl-terminal hydrolase n=1 Tax=Adineta ricciae TaxID=249248 RepID=A0A815DJV3_ADIRI|nr:unnamed protein product [Adineta ricciae]
MCHDEKNPNVRVQARRCASLPQKFGFPTPSGVLNPFIYLFSGFFGNMDMLDQIKKTFSERRKKGDESKQGPLKGTHDGKRRSSTAAGPFGKSRLQSSGSQRSNRSGLKESDETIELSIIPRLTPSVPVQVSSITTTVLPIASDQAFKGSMITTRFRSSSTLRYDWCNSFTSIAAPLASSETINIDRSIRDLAASSPFQTTMKNALYTPQRMHKKSRSQSNTNVKAEHGASTITSHSQMIPQSTHSPSRPIPKPRSRNLTCSSTLINKINSDETSKASLSDIPRLSYKRMKTTNVSSENNHARCRSQEEIVADSTPEFLDLTVMPICCEKKTIEHTTERKQNDGKATFSSLKSTSSEGIFFQPTEVQRGYCGLQNIGNTCYMSSALQCLSNVPDLTEYILKNGLASIINTTNDFGTQGKLAMAYNDLIKEMWSGKNKVTQGNIVKRYVSELSPRFAGYSQQDSHEFLNVLLGILHEDLKEESETIDYEKSLIADIFHGKLRSTVTCTCGEPVVTFDSTSFLALPIPDIPTKCPLQNYPSNSKKRTATLIDCLNAFFKTEKLSENGQWFCNKCERLMNAERQLDLWTPPKVLILQLKRFTYDISDNTKIQTLVEFPVNTPLDLRSFISDPNYKDNTLYDLVAISSHTGSLTGGHYTAYARNFLTKKWVHFDDAAITEADEKLLQSPNAYILIYRRQEPN